MILLVHLLFGAAIGSVVKNIPLAVLLAFLSHYLLDLLPHIEYPIENSKKRQWLPDFPTFLRISLDFFSGILLIFFFSKNQPIIYVCALVAIIPDGFTVLGHIFPNKVSRFHSYLHTDKIHFLKYKKIPNFWRVASQLAVAVISVIILKY